MISNHFDENEKIQGPDLKKSKQNLVPYWDEEFAQVLEIWGDGNVWNEIQYFLVGRKGKVLDIACGTGKAMHILSKFDDLEVFGCDISDFLIEKAINRGIKKQFLQVCDATQLGYAANFFDFSYSIGSLEHFTLEGISKCIRESNRITKEISFHHVPVSKSGNDEGWIEKVQCYFNNSSFWWLKKFQREFKTVIELDSSWNDEISKGKWFVCIKNVNAIPKTNKGFFEWLTLK